jgi:hypothetical protein
MTSLTSNQARLYVAVAFCAWFAVASFWHAAETWGGNAARLVHGRIVDYELVQQFPPLPWPRTPRYAVEFEEGGQRLTVHSTSALELFNVVPQNVTFWYSGDRSREVRLLETANPAAVGLVFMGLAALSFACAHGQRVWQWIGQ